MSLVRIAAVLSACWCLMNTAAAQVPTQPPGWVLDWSDEFDGPTLDKTKWVPETGGNDWVFEHPFFVILNLAVGGGWPGNPDAATAFPQQMLVDYVRVYKRAR